MTYQPPPQPYPQAQMPPVPPRKKKPPVWVWVVAVIGGLIILGAIGNALDGNKDKTTATTPAGAPIVTTQAFAPAPAVAPTTIAAGVPTTSAAVSVKEVTIPDDLVGKNGAVAADELKRLGFTNVTYGSATPGVNVVVLPSNWTVKTVEPGPGTVVSSDSPIVLTMTKNNR